MTNRRDYDESDAGSILAYARKLLGKSIHDLYPDAKYVAKGNKGGLGQSVEKVHFGFANNSQSEPDFKKAGVELKCTAVRQHQDGSMMAKDRLSLNIINYLEEYDKTYATSSFTRKNTTLLLMFYLYLKGVDKFDLLFKIIRLWQIPDEDIKIIMDDWAVIHDKIAHGLAHLLSETDTLYLAASPKGRLARAEMRKQRGTNIRAQQRAYSFKMSYVNQIILDSLAHPEMVSGITLTAKKIRAIKKQREKMGRIVRSVSEYRQGETFEQLVVRKFAPFIGMSVLEIEQELGVAISRTPKAISYSVCRAILGVKAQKIAEFENAGLQLKTIRLEANGGLVESMSFQNVRYCEIVNEETWEDSDWYDTIARHRFFFVVFRKGEKVNGKKDKPENAILEKVFFWGMPLSDIEKASEVWKDTRDKVRRGDYDHFMTMRDGNPVSHIRPKAKDSSDLMDTPQGGKAKKYCYWLNRPYVLEIVNSHMMKENGNA